MTAGNPVNLSVFVISLALSQADFQSSNLRVALLIARDESTYDIDHFR